MILLVDVKSLLIVVLSLSIVFSIIGFASFVTAPPGSGGACTCDDRGNIKINHCADGYYPSCTGSGVDSCSCLSCACNGTACSPNNNGSKCNGCQWIDVSSQPESCNGLDDDCDGVVDEGDFVKNVAPASSWVSFNTTKGVVWAFKDGYDKYNVVKITDSLSDCDSYSRVGLRFVNDSNPFK